MLLANAVGVLFLVGHAIGCGAPSPPPVSSLTRTSSATRRGHFCLSEKKTKHALEQSTEL